MENLNYWQKLGTDRSTLVNKIICSVDQVMFEHTSFWSTLHNEYTPLGTYKKKERINNIATNFQWQLNTCKLDSRKN